MFGPSLGKDSAMEDTPGSARDEALSVCETALEALLQGKAAGWEGLWGPHSVLAVAEGLYGPEGVQQLLDDGLACDDYLLVGTDNPPGHFLFEGITLSASGPMPFTTVQSQEPPYPLQNVLRSGLALASTVEHVEYLESIPHRPEPELLLPARARLSPAELRLVTAMDGLPRGWRSAACAITAWRVLRQRSHRPGHLSLQKRGEPENGCGLSPREDALLAAICYQTGPWRLMPLASPEHWQTVFQVSEEEFIEAWKYLHRALTLEFDYYLYMPKIPETGIMPDPTSDGDLMSLVSSFLDTLGEDEEEDGEEEEEASDGIFPLFPEGN